MFFIRHNIARFKVGDSISGRIGTPPKVRKCLRHLTRFHYISFLPRFSLHKIIDSPSYITRTIQSIVNLIQGILIIIRCILFFKKRGPVIRNTNRDGFHSGTGILFVPSSAPDIHRLSDRFNRNL